MSALWLVAIFVAGVFASHLLAAHTPAHFAIDVHQPLAVATNWGSFGVLTFAVLAAMLALAYVPYAVLLRRPPPLATTIAASAAALVAAMFFTPIFSSDVYAYAAYGEMARLGLDPYRHHTLPMNDPLFAAAQWQWNPAIPICVYGEFFVACARALMTLFASAPVTVQLDALRLLAVAAFIALIAVAYAIPREPLQKRYVATFIGCNPVLLWCVVEGHNDVLMSLAVVAAAALLARAPVAAIALAACGALIKMPAVLATVITGYRAYTAGHRRTIVATILALAAVAAGYSRWMHGVDTELVPHGHFAPFVSVQSIAWSLATAGGAPANVAAAAAAVTAGIFAAALAFAALRVRGVERYTMLALAAWVCIPNPYPWYALWILPLAAFAPGVSVRITALCVTAVALLRYLPDAAGPPSPWIGVLLGLAAAAAFAPISVVWRARRIVV